VHCAISQFVVNRSVGRSASQNCPRRTHEHTHTNERTHNTAVSLLSTPRTHHPHTRALPTISARSSSQHQNCLYVCACLGVCVSGCVNVQPRLPRQENWTTESTAGRTKPSQARREKRGGHETNGQSSQTVSQSVQPSSEAAPSSQAVIKQGGHTGPPTRHRGFCRRFMHLFTRHVR